MEPNNLRYLADRAVVRKKLGHQKEALSDIKRYFSFTDQNSAPENIQLLYKELSAMHAPAKSHDLIH
jgi:regulator of sirC expression with transglutaminase-like and TPR domain